MSASLLAARTGAYYSALLLVPHVIRDCKVLEYLSFKGFLWNHLLALIDKHSFSCYNVCSGGNPSCPLQPCSVFPQHNSFNTTLTLALPTILFWEVQPVAVGHRHPPIYLPAPRDRQPGTIRTSTPRRSVHGREYYLKSTSHHRGTTYESLTGYAVPVLLGFQVLRSDFSAGGRKGGDARDRRAEHDENHRCDPPCSSQARRIDKCASRK